MRNSIMRTGYLALLGLLMLAGCGGVNRGHAGLKIYIITDLEGASGVWKFAQTEDANNGIGREACEYLMDDIAAVVRGFRDGGATEIIVLDGHGAGTVVPHLMQAPAKYVTGRKMPQVLQGLDESFAGLAIIGQHAMMGTPDGVLHHTESAKRENRYWFNGVESGELATGAIMAAHYNVPPIMVSGDEACCREARQFFGPGCVTVAVKKGVAREAAVLYPFAETRQALYEGAKRAIAAIPRCKPYRVSFPIKAKKQWLVPVPNQPNQPPKLTVKEGLIEDPLRILGF